MVKQRSSGKRKPKVPAYADPNYNVDSERQLHIFDGFLNQFIEKSIKNVKKRNTPKKAKS